MASPSAITSEDRVVLFPALASPGPRDTWTVTVSGRVLRPRLDSLKRRALLAILAKALGLAPGGAARTFFASRAGLFLMESKPGRVVPLRAATIGRNAAPVASSPSESNGHFTARFTIPASRLGSRIEVVLPTGHPAPCSAPILRVPALGVSVVCDIDDTIKITRVWNPRATLRATLRRPFRPVAGMSSLLERLANAGTTTGSPAAFHYVSASPWQLFEPLEAFRQEHAFPPGSMHLKRFRFRAKNLPSLLDNPAPLKRSVITELMTRWPARRFVLVGDSAESDPEIYTQLAREFPGRVAAILIRIARRDRPRQAELERLLAPTSIGIATRWFSDPVEIDAPWLARALVAAPSPARSAR